MIVVAIIGILAAVAIPQYQNYIAKSQVSRVMAETGSLRTAVETCMMEGKVDCDLGWTNSNIIVGEDTYSSSDDELIQEGLEVTFDLSTGEASIAATFGGSASSAVRGKEVKWTRAANDSEDLAPGSWSCETTVEEKFAPAGCEATEEG